MNIPGVEIVGHQTEGGGGLYLMCLFSESALGERERERAAQETCEELGFRINFLFAPAKIHHRPGGVPELAGRGSCCYYRIYIYREF